jgi:probable rRNA maturation factor
MLTIVDDSYGIDTSYYMDKLQPLLKELDLKGTITIKLGDKEESQTLNATYRQKDYATDVLSFLLNEDLPDGYYLGDIFICYPVAETQAAENNISIQQELFTLMVHGILHLAGYDHETDDGQMMAMQEKWGEKGEESKK